MLIAVLSGKGGTGKTTVAASLALSLDKCQYADFDVEEPNGEIFLNPAINKSRPVKVQVPCVDEKECDGCGACAKACRFNAIAVVKKNVLIFPEVCHHCGACVIACPRNAVEENERETGVIEEDTEGRFMQGRLNIGEPSSIPVINAMKKALRDDVTVILDCAPGASCSVVRSIEGCDYCILVTEPTPFGLHDLKIAAGLVRKMGVSFGVVVNKAMSEDSRVQEYCGQEGIKVLMEIPYMREIAEVYSEGVLPVQTDEQWKERFRRLFREISEGETI